MKRASEEQVASLRENLVQELSTDAGRAMVLAYGGSHRCFERFIVARSYNIDEAAAMFRNTLSFRTSYGLDDGSFKIDEDLRARIHTYWPGAFSDGTSASGRPMSIFRCGLVNTSAMLANFTEEDFSKFYIAWMEQSLALQRERTKAAYQAGDSHAYTKLDAAWMGMLEVYDLTGLGPRQLAPNGLAMLTRVLSIGQKHYPENLGKCFIINAPLVFTAGWQVISVGFSALTLAKVTISSGDGGDELIQAVGDKERLDELMALVPQAETWSSWLGIS